MIEPLFFRGCEFCQPECPKFNLKRKSREIDHCFALEIFTLFEFDNNKITKTRNLINK